jgi:hypothetical protein
VTVFRFIAAKKTEHSVKTMCRVLEVSRSGFTPRLGGRLLQNVAGFATQLSG